MIFHITTTTPDCPNPEGDTDILKSVEESSERALCMKQNHLAKTAEICAGFTVGLAFLAAIGWLMDMLLLAQVKSSYIPMAPSTALSFILLGSGAYVRVRWPHHYFVKLWNWIGGIAVLVFGGILISQVAADFGSDIEGLMFGTFGAFEDVSMGRMSIITAGLLVLSSLSVVISLAGAEKHPVLAADILSFIVIASGFTLVLAYLYGTPVLYGKGVVPPALPTALSFLFMGLALLSLSGMKGWPLRVFVGTSMRAVLLRAFLPFIVLFMLLEHWIDVLHPKFMEINPALLSALWAIIVATALGMLVALLARRLGGDLDRTRALLQASVERYRNLVEKMPSAIFVHIDGRFVFLNPAGLKLLGAARVEDLIGKPILDIVHPDLHSVVIERVRWLREGKKFISPMELKWVTLDGRVVDVEIMAIPVIYEGKSAVQVIANDITERKRAENRFQTILHTTRDGFWIVGQDLHFEFVNDACCQMYGYSKEELLALTVLDMEVHESLEEIERRTRAMETYGYDLFECHHRRKDGKIIDVEVSVTYIKEEKVFFAFLRDITARKRVEEALRESELFLKESQSVAGVGSYMLDISTGIWKGSEALHNIFGIDINYKIEVDGWLQILHPEDREMMRNYLSIDVLTTHHPFDKEYRIVRIDDRKIRWLHGLGELEFSSGGNPLKLLGTIQDITERKQMEQERIRLQRLRAAGALSAGVSHNLNNILVGILGPAEMLKMQIHDPDLLEDVDDIIAAGTRARDLVHRLHLSTRGLEEETLHAVNVNRIVEEAVHITRPRWKDEPETRDIAIEILTDLGNTPPIKGTESRLHDIFVNLLLNAVEAMPNGGTITIATRTAGQYVQATICDTGVGMNEETLSRVFEPFFTTKTNVGSGLGLSTTYAAMTQWGGDIRVESQPGKCTTFTMTFPVWAEFVSEEVYITEKNQDKHSGKILIVDDDEGVFRVLSRMLMKEHLVEIAKSGQEALEMFVMGNYDVVLVDMGMPGMSGNMVLQEMHRWDPSIASVLISGWVFDETDERITKFDFRIQKPFSDINKVMDIVAQAMVLHNQRKQKA